MVWSDIVSLGYLFKQTKGGIIAKTFSLSPLKKW
jgi:hypothetical protein